MPRSKKKLDGVFDNPENVYQFFRKYSQSESFREWKKQIEEGPHPTTEILFDYSVGMLPDSEQEVWLEHIAHCIRCTKEVYSIRGAQRRLSKATEKSETREPNWAQSLKNIASSVKIGIQSFVDRWIEVIEPEPTGPTEPPFAMEESCGFMAMVQGYTQERERDIQAIKTKQFVAREVINIEIDIPKDGYVTAFTLSESGDMRLVFPSGEKVDTSVSAQQIKRIRFRASEPLGPWALKAIWTIDDPLGSRDLPFNEFWNDRALQCLAKHIKGLDKDGWAAGTLEFEVKQKCGKGSIFLKPWDLC